ncbi:dehydrogenase [Paenibacillus sp. 481]|uniref:dehydrogenase n=1 Tax=Paenibacillus sp. 481 TaxID=2835869 RepID=UPI001E51884C|nr:dehydrogenase [Paenibacillus sp. 481]UHA74750.1 dehydrogenase [Paenibacillus sp. 481]
MRPPKEQHESSLPSARKIRRACSMELYRTVKRLNVWIPEELLKQGEELYFKKVIHNSVWIHENHKNRKKLADWWDEAVSEELAALWNVEQAKLSASFRQAFGG